MAYMKIKVRKNEGKIAEVNQTNCDFNPIGKVEILICFNVATEAPLIPLEN